MKNAGSCSRSEVDGSSIKRKRWADRDRWGRRLEEVDYQLDHEGDGPGRRSAVTDLASGERGTAAAAGEPTQRQSCLVRPPTNLAKKDGCCARHSSSHGWWTFRYWNGMRRTAD